MTNRVSSKADIRAGSLYTKSQETLCGPSLHNTNANCTQKFFAGVLSPVNSPEAGKLHEVLPPHIILMPSARKHVFIGVMSTLLDTQVIGYATNMSGSAKQSEIYQV